MNQERRLEQGPWDGPPYRHWARDLRSLGDLRGMELNCQERMRTILPEGDGNHDAEALAGEQYLLARIRSQTHDLERRLLLPH